MREKVVTFRIMRKILFKKVTFGWKHEGHGGLFEKMKDIQKASGAVRVV